MADVTGNLIFTPKYWPFPFDHYYPGLNRTPDRNPGSGSATIYLERDRGRTRHEWDPRYIVSDSDMSLLIPGNVGFVSDEASNPTRSARVAILYSGFVVCSLPFSF